MSKTRVVVVDDHPTFREGLKSVLDRSGEVLVVGEAGNYDGGLAQYREHAPDVLLTDVTLSGRNGIELVRSIRDVDQDARCIVLSVHTGDEFRREAIRAGARAYLSKEQPVSEIISTIVEVASDEYAVPKTIAPQPAVDHRYERLSRREQEIFRLLAEGRSTKQIASDLSISAKTVETHRTNVMHKLGFESIADLVRYAIGIGVVDPMPSEW